MDGVLAGRVGQVDHSEREFALLLLLLQLVPVQRRSPMESNRTSSSASSGASLPQPDNTLFIIYVDNMHRTRCPSQDMLGKLSFSRYYTPPSVGILYASCAKIRWHYY